MSRSASTFDLPYGVTGRNSARLVEEVVAVGAVEAARRREDEAADAGLLRRGRDAHRADVVDVEGRRRVEVAERIVRQRGEVDDRVEAVEVGRG